MQSVGIWILKKNKKNLPSMRREVSDLFAVFGDLLGDTVVHRQIYRKSNRGNWGHLGGVWYKSITNIFLESHIVVQKCTTISRMKKWIIKPWDKCITNEICKTAKHLKPCTNLSQIEKSHKKEVDCSTSFLYRYFDPMLTVHSFNKLRSWIGDG